MAASGPRTARTDRSLLQALEAITGVRRAWTDPDGTVWVVVDHGADRHRVRADVMPILAAAPDTTLHIAALQEEPERPRVRFEGVERSLGNDRRVRVRVSLELRGQRITVERTTEMGEGVELRAVAEATLDALEQLTGARLGFRLVGAKRVHAFDADFVVVSFLRTAESPRHLVGTVSVSTDINNAAALAVLDAFNRLIGVHSGASPGV